MQGQSGYTRFKEQRFEPVLAQSLRISKAAKVAHYPYYHVDLNSGGGFNNDVQVSGSPLNFLKAVERQKRPNFYAFFVDKNPACIRELLARPELVGHEKRVSTFVADNSEILPLVAEFVAERERNPKYAMGSILIDPNGYHNGVPWDALRTFCHVHERFDLFFNLNMRTFRLEQPHIVDRDLGWTDKTLHPVRTFAEWFNRPNVMLTDEFVNGSAWVQIVARTMETASVGYTQLGFYDSRSTRGEAILTDIERPSQRVAKRANEFPLLQQL